MRRWLLLHLNDRTERRLACVERRHMDVPGEIPGGLHHPEALFMQQIIRTLTMGETGAIDTRAILICDRDRKWSRAVRQRFGDAGIRVVLTPERAPNANAYAERFARSIKEDVWIGWCLWGNAISVALSRSLSNTIITNGIIKGSTIG